MTGYLRDVVDLIDGQMGSIYTCGRIGEYVLDIDVYE